MAVLLFSDALPYGCIFDFVAVTVGKDQWAVFYMLVLLRFFQDRPYRFTHGQHLAFTDFEALDQEGHCVAFKVNISPPQPENLSGTFAGYQTHMKRQSRKSVLPGIQNREQ